MTENINVFIVFGAGLASVLSPCVLPVIPIVVTGTGNDGRYRPLLIVTGLGLTFILMGVVSSLFGSLIGSKIFYLEKAAAVLIVLFGILMIARVNLFKYLSFLSGFALKSRGSFGGLLMGLTLGIIWIPCVGPMLSSVLAMVATEGKLLYGVFFLFIYSLGFAVPMLVAGYATQFFRRRVSGLGKYPHLVSIGSGAVLVVLGVFIFLKGMVGFGMY